MDVHAGGRVRRSQQTHSRNISVCAEGIGGEWIEWRVGVPLRLLGDTLAKVGHRRCGRRAALTIKFDFHHRGRLWK